MKEDQDIVEAAWACCAEGAVIQARLHSPSRQEACRKSWQYVRASCAKRGRDGN